MTSKEKSVAKEIKAAEVAWKERYGNKPTETYYVNGKFANAHIDGSWPVDVFLNGFYHGLPSSI